MRGTALSLSQPGRFGRLNLLENRSEQPAEGCLLFRLQGLPQQPRVARDENREGRTHETTAGRGELDNDGAPVGAIAISSQQPQAFELIHAPGQPGTGEHQAARHPGG
jgi:hypothetical protein